ncbi:uncharacterized protein At5g39865-like [Magnolia sinica]|uniref:uncharacterized protein At5g39865-like n=1 Tax=Magnolia sinica TaxID=86752 RepID=UPI00265B1105|nr:uncharacterized protein At5g39865-like [Magnolia sinica]
MAGFQDSSRNKPSIHPPNESKKSYPFISNKNTEPHPFKTQTPPPNPFLRRAFSCKQSNPSSAHTLFKRPGINDTNNKILLYFTSIGGIRRTYEDCCAVRTILGGFRVPVDERDVSMDSAYRHELQSMLAKEMVALPQVFIRGKHIGGAEEIKALHETGELAKLLEGFPVRNLGFACKGCGNTRFVLCANCDGSRKVFIEEEGRLRRCSECNEHGLVRCNFCL